MKIEVGVEGVLRDCVALNFNRWGRRITRIYEHELRPFGLSIWQFNILAALAGNAPLRTFELARLLDLEPSGASRSTNRMVAKSWLGVTLASDLRSPALCLESAGASLLRRAYPAWERAQRRAQEELAAILTCSFSKDHSGPFAPNDRAKRPRQTTAPNDRAGGTLLAKKMTCIYSSLTGGPTAIFPMVFRDGVPVLERSRCICTGTRGEGHAKRGARVARDTRGERHA